MTNIENQGISHHSEKKLGKQKIFCQCLDIESIKVGGGGGGALKYQLCSKLKNNQDSKIYRTFRIST